MPTAARELIKVSGRGGRNDKRLTINRRTTHESKKLLGERVLARWSDDNDDEEEEE